MWDYDKLFAEGNIVGLHNVRKGETYGWTVVDKSYWHQSGQINWQDYFNSNLSFDTGFYLFEIQYIIRLDDKGQVAERLFDRNKDMSKPMPKLETGMFVRVIDNGNMDYTVLGYVDIQNYRIIYQDGKYNDIVKLEGLKGIVDVVEVYSQETNCFNKCLGNNTLIWRSSEYQDYLDSKN